MWLLRRLIISVMAVVVWYLALVVFLTASISSRGLSIRGCQSSRQTKLGKSIANLFGAAALSLNPVNAHALEAPQPPLMKTWVDKVDKYSVDYPVGWTVSNGELSGERTVTAFVSDTKESTSISIVATPIPADFTRLTSFGDLNSYLVPRGEGIETEVLSQSSKGESMTIEYVSMKKPEDIKRHVVTVFALRPAESVIGLTAQALEADFAGDKAQIDAAVKSFKVISP